MGGGHNLLSLRGHNLLSLFAHNLLRLILAVYLNDRLLGRAPYLL